MPKTEEKLTLKSQLDWKQSLIVIGAFSLFFYFFWKDDQPKQPRQMSQADKEFYMIEASKDGVRALLKDPKSAVFQNVGYVDHLTPAVCGHVNSRNSFGGMSGFQRFIARGETMVLLEQQADDFFDAWNTICVNAEK